MQDEELIKRVKNGDKTALDTVVKTYYNEIYRFLCRKLQSPADAQDVAQTVFVKFINGVHGYKENGRLRNYIFKLAVNASNDYFRKPASHLSLEELPELQSDSLSPEQIAAGKITGELVRKALRELPAYQRDVIVLRFYHNLPFKDIARIMNCNLSSTKSRHRQGMEKLKTLLKEDYV